MIKILPFFVPYLLLAAGLATGCSQEDQGSQSTGDESNQTATDRTIENKDTMGDAFFGSFNISNYEAHYFDYNWTLAFFKQTAEFVGFAPTICALGSPDESPRSAYREIPLVQSNDKPRPRSRAVR